MNLKDIFAFPFKRVNPFPGLAIDADTWRDAHDYSRNQQRLHNLLFHEVGIIEGLEVTANDPPDLSVNINPGFAIDAEGNTIIVPAVYHYQIQNRDKETIYLIIQFREILEGPYQPPEGGQPTRIIDGYRIQERDDLPDEPHLELARIDLDAAAGVITDAADKLQPAKNEIGLNFRKEVKKTSGRSSDERTTVIVPGDFNPGKKVVIGYVAANGSREGVHLHGLRNLARELELLYNWEVELEENVALNTGIERFSLVYLTGSRNFSLNDEERSALRGFMKSGGVIVAEDCSEAGKQENGAGKHSPVHDELVEKLKVKMKPVRQGDPLLSSINVFSGIPRGAREGVFLKADYVIYSDNDYGCAWQGGCKGDPLSRDVIRGAFEIGANIIDYAYRMKTSVRKQTIAATD